MQAIKFIYFAHNFTFEQLEQMLTEATPMKDHFMSKFKFYSECSQNGTQAFIDLFMSMGINYQETIVKWIETNYKGI